MLGSDLAGSSPTAPAGRPGYVDPGQARLSSSSHSTAVIGTAVGELVEEGRLDAAGVEVTGDQAVSLGAVELGEHLARDAVEGTIEVLLAGASFQEPPLSRPETRTFSPRLLRIS